MVRRLAPGLRAAASSIAYIIARIISYSIACIAYIAYIACIIAYIACTITNRILPRRS